MTHEYDGSIYIGQFFGNNEKIGYGLMTYDDGSTYAGFFFESKPHGIGVKTDSENKKVFTVHDWEKGELYELKTEDVDAVNNGTKHIEQMDVFFKDYMWYNINKGKPSDFFGYKDVKELNFKFIEHEDRHKMCLLIEDLEAIAHKNGMDQHELDPETDKQIQKQLDIGDDKFKQIMMIYKKTDEHFEVAIKEQSSKEELEEYLQNRKEVDGRGKDFQ